MTYWNSLGCPVQIRECGVSPQVVSSGGLVRVGPSRLWSGRNFLHFPTKSVTGVSFADPHRCLPQTESHILGRDARLLWKWPLRTTKSSLSECMFIHSSEEITDKQDLMWSLVRISDEVFPPSAYFYYRYGLQKDTQRPAAEEENTWQPQSGR